MDAAAAASHLSRASLEDGDGYDYASDRSVDDATDETGPQMQLLMDPIRSTPTRSEAALQSSTTATITSILRGPDDAAPRRSHRRRWFGLVQLVLLNLVVSWDWLTFAPVASSAAAFYAVPTSTINTISVVFLFAFVPAAPLTMLLLHRGPRPAMLVAAVLILVGNWLRYAGSFAPVSASAHNGRGHYFPAVVVGQMLCGLAQPLVLAAPTRYSELWFSPGGRVAATAVASLANPFGAALGQLVNPFLVDGNPDNVSRMVLVVAVIATACAIPTFFVPARPPGTSSSSLSSSPSSPPSFHPAVDAVAPRLGLRKSLRVALSSLEVWLVLVPFWIYVGLFNSVSSVLNQIMVPHGFTDDEAGIGGAILIVVGLLASAIFSPILDRTKQYLVAIKILVPVIALSYLVFVWMPATGMLAGPYLFLAVLGASSFSLVPVALEYLSELSYPASPEIAATLAWTGGQILGAAFIYLSDGLAYDKDEGSPPGNMDRALTFQAIAALLAAPFPLALGLFGRRNKVALKRMMSLEEERREASQ